VIKLIHISTNEVVLVNPKNQMFPEQLANLMNDFKDKNKHKLKSFSEYINEMPIGYTQDCHFGQETLMKLQGIEDYLDSFSWSGVEDYRTLINKGSKQSKYMTIMTNEKNTTFLGFCDDGLFKILSRMYFKEVKTIFGSTKQVTEVNTHSDYRRKDYARAIYKSMLFDGDVIMSDSVQYYGAIRLWKSFIKEHTEWKYMIDDRVIAVVLYDNINSKIVSDDLTNTKDEDIWSFAPDTSKSEYRLVAYIK